MAMGVNKTRVVRKTRSLNNLTLLNVACPVCMGILIEPVTLPCNHDLCLECFEKSVENNSLTCPMCRKRIGGWLRQAKDKSLVNQTLWKLIQEKFPHEVQSKLKGDDDGVADRISAMIPPVSLSSEGEIGKEFDLEVKKYEEEIRRKQEEEHNASLEYIRKLQEEEDHKRLEATKLITEDEKIARKVQESETQEDILEAERQKRRQAEEDEKIARQLQEQMKMGNTEVMKPKSTTKEIKHSPSTSGTTHVKGPMDSFVYQVKQKGTPDNTKASKCKIKTYGKEKRSRSQSSDSIDSEDSIRQELVHFKPIRIVPRTPPKKMPDGRVFEPGVIVASPLGINDLCHAVRKGSNLNPTARKLAENFMKMQKRPYEWTISPPTEGHISKSVGTNQSSAFKGRDFIRKLDPYNASLKRSEVVSEPDRKKFCTETKELHHHTASLGFSSMTSVTKAVRQVMKIENTAPSTFVSSLDSAVSPVEVCRTAEDDDLHMTDIAHITDSYAGSCESRAKTSTDSGKISLCEEDSAKMHFSNDAAKKIVDNRKRVHETLFYEDKKNENSLTINNNNNVEMETGSGDDAVCDSGIEDERVVVEQARIEQQIRQEQEDLRLAMELQRKWDMESRTVDRRKGTSRAYELRSTSISQAAAKPRKGVMNKGSRQRTLQEAFHNSTQRLVAHSGP